MDPDKVLAQYDQALQQAIAAANDVENRYTNAVQRLGELPDAPQYGNDPQAATRKQLADQINALSADITRAHASVQAAYEAKAAASQKLIDQKAAKGTTPEEQAAYVAHLKAQAAQDTAQAAKITADLKEWQDAAPERKQAVLTKQLLDALTIQQQEQQIALAAEENPLKRRQLQQQIDQGQTQLAVLQTNAKYADRVAAAGAQSAEAGARTATAGATSAEATAGVAGGVAQAGLRTAQATADQAELNLKKAQAEFDALTPEMRTEAAKLALEQARIARDQAAQNLINTQRQADTADAAQQAGTEATRTNTQQQQLGGFAFLDQKKKALKDAIARGDMTPDDAAAAWNEQVQTAVTGMNAQTRGQQAQADYGLQTTRASSQSSALTSGTSSMLASATNIGDPEVARRFGTQFHKDLMSIWGPGPAITPGAQLPSAGLAQSVAPRMTAQQLGFVAPPAPTPSITVNVNGAPAGAGGVATPPPPPLLPAGMAGMPGLDPNLSGQADPDRWHQQSVDNLQRYVAGQDRVSTGLGGI